MKTKQVLSGFPCRIPFSIVTGAIVLLSAIISLPGTAAKGGGGGGGGGEPVEVAGNNLSFPVLWGDGSMALPGNPLVASLLVPWSETVEDEGKTYFAYAQKTEGNIWQAESSAWNHEIEGSLVVDEIDWGDSLESVDMKVGRPVRIELSLYKLLAEVDYMTGYKMAMLANPSSPDEVQGVIASSRATAGNPVTDPLTYQSSEATVYTANGKLVVQKLNVLRENVDEGDLTWNGTEWVDADPSGGIIIDSAQDLTFSSELNVGGKVIFGLSKGGWRPTSASDYRITFYLPMGTGGEDPKVSFDDQTIIREAIETEAVAPAEGVEAGGSAHVDPDNNLTYIDVRVVAGGGSGKPKKAK